MKQARRGQRGMTLLEILVSLAILSMIALLIYGAFESLGRGKRGEAMKAERSRQARSAVLRMARELKSSYVSMHFPTSSTLQTRKTAFIGSSSTPFDRVDFAAFVHRRTTADSKESDQAEVGYFVVRDPDKSDKMDLVRREQSPPDTEPKKGGVINVLCEDVESFDIRYLDPLTSQWLENWDTTQGATGQANRMPFEVEIKLVLKDPPPGVEKTYLTKIVIPVQQSLSFGIPR